VEKIYGTKHALSAHGGRAIAPLLRLIRLDGVLK
jgi:hypothetical protein